MGAATVVVQTLVQPWKGTWAPEGPGARPRVGARWGWARAEAEIQGSGTPRKPGCSVASLSLSLINQMTGQEVGQRGRSLLKARHTDRDRVEPELRSFASRATVLSTARRAAGLPKVFPFTNKFLQLLLPRDLS